MTAASASGGTAWNQSYSYDGFGNLTSKSGSGATFTNSVDQTTNRLAFGNFCYDPNGNVVSDQNGGGCGNPNYGYDVANRMVSAAVSGGTERYYYTADNKRVSTISSSGVQTIFIYGAAGEKLAVVFGGGGSIFTGQVTNNVYFAGRLIKQGTDAISGTQAYATNPDDAFVGIDRLGSVRKTQAGVTSYLPYGEELSGTGNGAIKFATYTRDASTGLDYADQRYYTSQFGRFMSADRYQSSAGPGNPLSWNKYLYGLGDPVNRFDPLGQESFCTDDDCDESDDGDDYDGDQSSAGAGGGATFSVTVTTTAPSDPPVTCDLDCLSQAGVYTPLTGQPPNSFYIDPQPLGPVMRLFNGLGNWLLDIHYQGNHLDIGNPHIHVPTQPNGNRFSGPRTPVSAPAEPVVPPNTTPYAPYSPWPRQATPVVPIPPLGGITLPFLPIVINIPCVLNGRSCDPNSGKGGT